MQEFEAGYNQIDDGVVHTHSERCASTLPATNLEDNMKQVIIMRTDLNMRKGKMVAQGCHATLGIFIQDNISEESLSEWIGDETFMKNIICLGDDVIHWISTGMKKICLSCNGETELLDLYNKAKEAKLPAYYVKDAGHTELKPNTITCCAIGPADEFEIDKITGHLKLL